MQIRPYQPKDYENCRDICQFTSSLPKLSKDTLCTLYCEYYIENEPENAFVLADDDDNCIGYIICAENYKKFIKGFKATKLKKLKQLCPKEARMKRVSFLMDRIAGRKYPAHLHIDLMPEGRNKGYGTEMINTLIAHLKAKGVKGLHLGVGASNTAAHRFYERNGFKRFAHFKNIACIYCMNLVE